MGYTRTTIRKVWVEWFYDTSSKQKSYLKMLKLKIKERRLLLSHWLVYQNILTNGYKQNSKNDIITIRFQILYLCQQDFYHQAKKSAWQT